MTNTQPPTGLNPNELFRYDLRAIEAKLARAVLATDLEPRIASPGLLAEQIANVQELISSIGYLQQIQREQADWEGDQVPVHPDGTPVNPQHPRKSRRKKRRGDGPNGISISVS